MSLSASASAKAPPEQVQSLLYGLLEQFTQEMEVDELLRRAAETILRFDYKYPVDLSISCAEGGAWEWRAGRWIEKADAVTASTGLRTHVEQALRSGKALCTQTPAPHSDTAVEAVYGSAMAVPIKFAGRVLGVLSMECAHSHVFGDRELEFVAAVAHILAIALPRTGFCGLSVTAPDEYERMADELTERQRKLDKLLEILPVGVSILNAERQIVYMNPAISAILQLSEDSLISGDYAARRYLAADGSPMAPEAFASALAAFTHEPVYNVETGVVKEDGEIIWTNVSAVPVDFSDWKTVIATTDITHRKHVEQMLRQWADAFENCAHGIAIGDPAINRIRTCNPAFARLQGGTIQELTATPILSLYSPDEHERVKLFMQEADRTGNVRFEANMIRSDGSAYPVQMDVVSVRDEAGKLLYRVATQQDITERKKAEEELRRSNLELEQFAYVASHDLQEPLRGIAGMVQLLQKRYQDQLDERGNEYIQHAVDASVRMQEMIRDLLAYSRAGRIDVNLETTDLGQILHTVQANLETSIRETGATITHDDLPVIAADPLQMTQLLQNLIANGIKFRGERPPQIHIGVLRQNEMYLFSVRDNGIGIEPRHHERIFLLFQRLHARSNYPGTGIGLALCKKIVERHGGRIWVESSVGEGSVFCFSLPARSLPDAA